MQEFHVEGQKKCKLKNEAGHAGVYPPPSCCYKMAGSFTGIYHFGKTLFCSYSSQDVVFILELTRRETELAALFLLSVITKPICCVGQVRLIAPAYLQQTRPRSLHSNASRGHDLSLRSQCDISTTEYGSLHPTALKTDKTEVTTTIDDPTMCVQRSSHPRQCLGDIATLTRPRVLSRKWLSCATGFHQHVDHEPPLNMPICT